MCFKIVGKNFKLVKFKQIPNFKISLAYNSASVHFISTYAMDFTILYIYVEIVIDMYVGLCLRSLQQNKIFFASNLQSEFSKRLHRF